MCTKNRCTRHEIWGGICRPHLWEHLHPKPKRRRKKKTQDNSVVIDAVEVVTTDLEGLETRNDT